MKFSIKMILLRRNLETSTLKHAIYLQFGKRFTIYVGIDQIDHQNGCNRNYLEYEEHVVSIFLNVVQLQNTTESKRWSSIGIYSTLNRDKMHGCI